MSNVGGAESPTLRSEEVDQWKLSRGGRCQPQDKSSKGWVSFLRKQEC